MTGYSSELSASPTNNKQTTNNKTKLVEQTIIQRELSHQLKKKHSKERNK